MSNAPSTSTAGPSAANATTSAAACGDVLSLDNAMERAANSINESVNLLRCLTNGQTMAGDGQGKQQPKPATASTSNQQPTTSAAAAAAIAAQSPRPRPAGGLIGTLDEQFARVVASNHEVVHLTRQLRDILLDQSMGEIEDHNFSHASQVLQRTLGLANNASTVEDFMTSPVPELPPGSNNQGTFSPARQLPPNALDDAAARACLAAAPPPPPQSPLLSPGSIFGEGQGALFGQESPAPCFPDGRNPAAAGARAAFGNTPPGYACRRGDNEAGDNGELAELNTSNHLDNSFLKGENFGPFEQIRSNCPSCRKSFYLKTRFTYNGLNPRNPIEQEIKNRFSIVTTGEYHPFEESNDLRPFGKSPPNYLNFSGDGIPAANDGFPGANDLFPAANVGFDDFVDPNNFGNFDELDWLSADDALAGMDGLLAPLEVCKRTTDTTTPPPPGQALCPPNPPFEYQNVNYQSFDRMNSSCPYCRIPLNLKTTYTYLGVNADYPQEHQIKLSFKAFAVPKQLCGPMSV